MDQRIVELQSKIARVGEVEVDFSKAARVSPETLRSLMETAAVWHVSSSDAAACMPTVKRRDDFPAAIEALADYLLGRFGRAAEIGISGIIMDEPCIWGAEVFMSELANHLRMLGLAIKLGRVSRHRHCPHVNATDDQSCLHDGDFDHGAGDINALYLEMQLPARV